MVNCAGKASCRWVREAIACFEDGEALEHITLTLGIASDSGVVMVGALSRPSAAYLTLHCRSSVLGQDLHRTSRLTRDIGD
jgi:hypothetical protein